MGIKGYTRPKTLHEALEIMAELGPSGLPIAGGTDLLVDLRAGKLGECHLVDISRLEELKVLKEESGKIRVGAGLTFSEIEASSLLREHAPVLVKACSQIGSLQIRNMGTIGGNVAHCSPAADTVPVLLVHRAKAILKSRNGSREVDLECLLGGPYKSHIYPGELITEFILERASFMWGEFAKIGRRKELAIARLSLAALARKEHGRIVEIYLALGAGTPVPMRMESAEKALLGTLPREEDLWDAGWVMAQEMVLVSGPRPSTQYKQKAACGLLVRALLPLVENCQENGLDRKLDSQNWS